MSELRQGDVYISDGLLYFEEDWVHLADNKGYKIEPHDAAVLELVSEGVSSFPLLCDELCERAALDRAALEGELAESLSDPRSILSLRAPVEIKRPEVIVCDFSGGGPSQDSRRLVERLRRRFQVLFLGLDDRVRGPRHQNLSPKRSRKVGLHKSWFQFAQWCRGVVRKHSDAALVLCGHQDTVIFGDLVKHVRTFIPLEAGWPSHTGISDFLGTAADDEESLQATRGLIYALRFGSLDDLQQLNRASSSDFAVLERRALRHADVVGYHSVDQPPMLERLGREPSTNRLVFDARPDRFARSAPDPARRILLLIAGLEEGAQPLAPFLTLLRDVRDTQHLFESVAIVGPMGWRIAVQTETGGRLLPWSGPLPAPSEIVAALAFPGLLRHVETVADAVSAGVPTLIVPSAKPHPLQDGVPSDLLLRDITPAVIAETLRDLCDPAHRRAERVRELHKQRVAPWELSTAVSRWVQSHAMTGAEVGATAMANATSTSAATSTATANATGSASANAS